MACPSETLLQAFIDGDLEPAEIAELSRHLDQCSECRTLVGVVQPVPLDDESTADRVGRYVLRRVLGRGGMGVVYEAVDPELHRVVALKILRSDLGALQSRLLGEAEAMAKLAHPNVVTIYDVGRAGDRVFIVMALVRGLSLRQWLAREPRALPTVIDVFVQAAEGLRAAHQVGLVHRDFKPDNVLVAHDGRVLVTDFGLAIPTGAEASASEGSLGYMAPEQRRGQRVDERSDQYAFCVSLREALEPDLPRFVAKIVQRGSNDDPARRFPSMAEVIDALRAGRRSSRARRLAIVGVAAAAAMAGAAAFAVRSGDASRAAAVCREGDAEIAKIWSPAVASKTQQTFRDTKSPLWESAWRKVDDQLKDYASAWGDAHRRSCALARSSGPTSDADRRRGCLSERLEIFRAVAGRLEQVDAPMLEQVPAMLQLLPRVSACESEREIAQQAPAPPPEKAAASSTAQKKIARAAATIAAGRYEEGLTLAKDAWKSANEASWLPVLAEAYLWVGTAHGRLGQTRESAEALEHAVSSASAGHAPEIAIRSWIRLMHFVGFEGKRYDDGFRYSDYAKAALESMPGAFELEAERLSWSRAMLLDQKRFDDALIVSRQELALVELRFGKEHRLAAAALDGLAGVHAGKCRARDGIEPQQKACAILEKELGSPHPQVAACLTNLAALHANLGEHARAHEIKERALAMFEQIPGHPNHVAMAHRNMVRSLLELGRLAEAARTLEAATALSKRESEVTSILVLRGELRRRQGEAAEALADHALAVTRTKDGDPPRRLEPLVALAETHLAAGRFPEAAAIADEAAKVASNVYGAGSCRTATPLRLQAEALVATDRVRDAVPLLERALGALTDAQLDPLLRARVELTLARSLPAEASERARQLASSARDIATRDGREPALVASAEKWLEGRTVPDRR